MTWHAVKLAVYLGIAWGVALVVAVIGLFAWARWGNRS